MGACPNRSGVVHLRGFCESGGYAPPIRGVGGPHPAALLGLFRGSKPKNVGELIPPRPDFSDAGLLRGGGSTRLGLRVDF